MGRLKEFTKSILYGISSLPLFHSIALAAEEEKAVIADALLGSELTAAKEFVEIVIAFFVEYSFQVLGGVLILLLGWLAARFIAKFLQRFLSKHNVDVTISKFIVSIVKFIVIAFAALIALGKFGITIAPLIAGISVAGFGLSFALQGPLSNYAAGITLIFTKPFKVGEIVEVTDAMGEVMDITLARTILKTLDGNLIVVPNKQIIGEIIHNYSQFKKLDITVGVSYDTDVHKAVEVVKNIVQTEKRVTKTPAPKVGISEFADSSINIYSRLWCKQQDYLDVKFDVHKRIYDDFKKSNIAIPFPQRDVHIYEEK